MKKNLFDSFKIGNVEIKNRIVMPPMCMHTAKNGEVNDFHILHYGSRSIGGVGLIIVEATSVQQHYGNITDQDLGIWDDSFIFGLSKIATAIHKFGAKAAIQLGHAGRKCESKYVDKIYGPSPIKFESKYVNYLTPTEMTIKEIQEVKQHFIDAAIRAKKAGFDMVEIHAAHGYLLSSFLTPISNQRDDVYGQNKALLLEEILTGIKKANGSDYPIIVRISAYDWHPNGNKPQDFIEMLNPLIKQSLIDAIDVSTGGTTEDAKITAYDCYQIPFCLEIKQNVNVPCIGGGLIVDAKSANKIVENEAADAVYIGRQLLRNPYWPIQASEDLNIDIKFPKQYERAKLVK
ncbi:NADH-dependent flavin oxidoreductase [Malacoplasma penetrans HF-2]|uniref:NADH-dependent flavin oxidoreductase n=1 Tax=Malacoplasma penetrans (strain HF-2) TaxID=272633 RepID=Q8EUM2_MALP2|nr:NADH:flavin oxidoreductase/NADH oxidase [Malacoplasma penetrans]BAC44690.1 NADH-dependent flavin oxidoreductase [Malacoplasma penetrans HF-2]